MIVFFGTAPFAVPILEAVAKHVSLVVSQPDRPTGRGLHVQLSPVKAKAIELGLAVETPEKSRAPEFVERLVHEKPDFLLVAAYGQILSERVLDTGRHGAFNLHGSILPKYRGAAPIQRAILSGESETGVTLMKMDKGMDTGDMIDIRKLGIGNDETYGDLQSRLAELAAEQTRDWFDRLRQGDFEAAAQDPNLATYAPKIEKEEAELRFERFSEDEYNRFRAFTPSPGAYFHTRFGRLRLSQVRLSDQVGEPGTVRMPNLVTFNGGSLELIEVQPEGKRRMAGRDFFNGCRLRNGDSLVRNET